MAEKRFKLIINHNGDNIEVETLQGFEGNSCQYAMDQVMATIGGNCVKKEDRDSDSGADLKQFLNL